MPEMTMVKEAPVPVAVQHPYNQAVPGAVLEVTPNGLVVEPGKLLDLARYLRDHEGYTYLSMVTSVDYPAYIEVVYYLYAVAPKGGTPPRPVLVLKARLA